jgi:hypothetical protein
MANCCCAAILGCCCSCVWHIEEFLYVKLELYHTNSVGKEFLYHQVKDAIHRHYITHVPACYQPFLCMHTALRILSRAVT